MIILVSVALFGVLATVITAFGYGRYAKPARFLQQLSANAASPEVSLESIGQAKQSGLVRQVQALGRHAPVSPQDAQSARRMLVAAGYRKENAVGVLYGCKLIVMVAFAVLAIISRTSITSNPVLRIVFPIAATGTGYWLPTFLLSAALTNAAKSCAWLSRMVST